MNTKDIVAEWLELNGFDGLYSPNGECACKNGDLFPCGDIYECKPGMFADSDEENDFYIVKRG